MKFTTYVVYRLLKYWSTNYNGLAISYATNFKTKSSPSQIFLVRNLCTAVVTVVLNKISACLDTKLGHSDYVIFDKNFSLVTLSFLGSENTLTPLYY